MCKGWSVYQASQYQHSAQITSLDQTSCTLTIEDPNWFNTDSRTLLLTLSNKNEWIRTESKQSHAEHSV